MKSKFLFAALLVAFAAPSMASTFDLGDLSVPGLSIFGNSFSNTGTYEDDYTFSINTAADAGGLVLELDPFLNSLNIDVTKVTLSSLGGSSFAPDLSPSTYDFGALSSGSYTLSIFSSVTGSKGLTDMPVGYVGVLALGSVRSTAVPEPGTLALFGVGLLGVAFAARRRPVRN